MLTNCKTKGVDWILVESVLRDFNKLYQLKNLPNRIESFVRELKFVRDDGDVYLLKRKANGVYATFKDFLLYLYAALSGTVTCEGFERLWKYAFLVFETLCKDTQLCDLWNLRYIIPRPQKASTHPSHCLRLVQGFFGARLVDVMQPDSFILWFPPAKLARGKDLTKLGNTGLPLYVLLSH